MPAPAEAESWPYPDRCRACGRAVQVLDGRGLCRDFRACHSRVMANWRQAGREAMRKDPENLFYINSLCGKYSTKLYT